MLRKMIQVDSQNLHSVGYDRAEKALSIRFNHDPSTVYTYWHVKPQVFVDLMNAASLGKWFNENVKSRYDFTKTRFSGE